MRILIFQHLDQEGGGSFLRFLTAGGAELTTVNFGQNPLIPDLTDFDAMLVLGGPMDVWDVDIHPWLVKEKAAIRHFVRDMQRPYLGLCLGHQLLADALGGTCGPQLPKQVGSFDITLTPEGRTSALFQGMSPVFRAYKWHYVRVAQLPDGAVRLAHSDECRCEAMQAAPRAFGVQFHPEFQQETLDEWHTIPGTPALVMEHFGAGGLQSARADADPYVPAFLKNAETLVNNFLKIV
jgi:GMP synthase-like glutamine amidotransferase